MTSENYEYMKEGLQPPCAKCKNKLNYPCDCQWAWPNLYESAEQNAHDCFKCEAAPDQEPICKPDGKPCKLNHDEHCEHFITLREKLIREITNTRNKAHDQGLSARKVTPEDMVALKKMLITDLEQTAKFTRQFGLHLRSPNKEYCDRCKSTTGFEIDDVVHSCIVCGWKWADEPFGFVDPIVPAIECPVGCGFKLPANTPMSKMEDHMLKSHPDEPGYF